MIPNKTIFEEKSFGRNFKFHLPFLEIRIIYQFLLMNFNNWKYNISVERTLKKFYPSSRSVIIDTACCITQNDTWFTNWRFIAWFLARFSRISGREIFFSCVFETNLDNCLSSFHWHQKHHRVGIKMKTIFDLWTHVILMIYTHGNKAYWWSVSTNLDS